MAKKWISPCFWPKNYEVHKLFVRSMDSAPGFPDTKYKLLTFTFMFYLHMTIELTLFTLNEYKYVYMNVQGFSA